MRLEVALQREHSDALLHALPAPRLHQFAFGHLRYVQAGHRHAQILTRFEQLGRILVVCSGFDDGAWRALPDRTT